MNTALSHLMSRLGVRCFSEITVWTRPLNLYPILQTGELATLNRQVDDLSEKLRCETTPRDAPFTPPLDSRVPSAQKNPMLGD